MSSVASSALASRWRIITERFLILVFPPPPGSRQLFDIAFWSFGSLSPARIWRGAIVDDKLAQTMQLLHLREWGWVAPGPNQSLLAWPFGTSQGATGAFVGFCIHPPLLELNRAP